MNYWIFQGRPDVYDIVSSLKDGALKTWGVKAHENKIKPGDKVILWVTGPDAGCYALATVNSEVINRADDEQELKYYRDAAGNEPSDRVEISIDCNFSSDPVLRPSLKAFASFQDFKGSTQGTNFTATKEQYDTFFKLRREPSLSGDTEPSDIISSFFIDLKKKMGYKNRLQIHDFFWKHEHTEIASRYEVFKKIAGLLDGSDPSRKTLDYFAKEDVFLLGGHSSIQTQKTDFCAHKDAEEATSQLLKDTGDRAFVVEQFVSDAVRLGFKKKDGTPVRSNAALLASVILTALKPEQFVDYRRDRWRRAAKHLNLTKWIPSKETPYGNALIWAGEVAREISETPAFKEVFGNDEYPLWTVSGFVILCFSKKESWREVLEKASALAVCVKEDVDMNDIEKEGAAKTPSLATNTILYGPPGTGKTYHSINHAVALCRGVPVAEVKKEDENKEGHKAVRAEYDSLYKQGRIAFCTFHQSMSYEDFVEGIKPCLGTDKNVNYKIEDGVFKSICKASKNSDQPYVLIIDEINRGNVSAILGELITLLEPDKRTGQDNQLLVKLPYSKDSNFGVPSNLHVIGTMNTADRSVEALDTALRRRFSFIEMLPNPSLLKGKEIGGVNLTKLLKTINERIEYLLDKDHLIGHSYFMEIATVDELQVAFKDRIIPLLQEYFYRDYNKIGLVLGSGFVEVKEGTPKFSLGGFDDDVTEVKMYDLLKPEGSEFVKALEILKNRKTSENNA